MLHVEISPLQQQQHSHQNKCYQSKFLKNHRYTTTEPNNASLLLCLSSGNRHVMPACPRVSLKNI